MRLSELEALFVAFVDHTHHKQVDDIHHADGVLFVCPVCFVALGGRAGAHSILCWEPCVPADVSPGPGRWHLSGTSIDDLTLAGATSDSVLLAGDGCKAHFYVRHGDVVLC